MVRSAPKKWTREHEEKFGKLKERIDGKISEIEEELANANGERGALLERVDDLRRRRKRVVDYFVKENMPLARGYSLKLGEVYKIFCLDDFFSETQFALIEAAQKWDYKRGYRFSTYACRVMKMRVLRYVINKRPSHVCSLDELDVNERGIIDSGSKNPLSLLVERDGKRFFKGILGELPGHYLFVINERYLNGNEKKTTLEDIGKMFGVTGEAVRKWEVEAFRRLRRKIGSYYRVGGVA